MSNIRIDRINRLAALIGAKSYLEIGVDRGITFANIDVPKKMGVDPKFRFDYQNKQDKATFFYEMTSDEFFTHHATQHQPFDLIFLDGLHVFEQTFRDFCISLAFSHSRTVWLIDDTLPSSNLASFRSHEMTKRLRKILRSKDVAWMGDVYKTIFAIHDFFPQYSYRTFPEHGQTVVWKEIRHDFRPKWNSLGEINKIGYRQFLDLKVDFLRVAASDEIFSDVERWMRKTD